MKRAALYARVSTTKEEQDGSLERQEATLRAHAHHRGFALADANVYIDRASGGTADREGYQALRAAVARREVDVVLVARTHRLARSVRELCAFSDDLRALGVDLVILEEGVDTTTAHGRLVYQILGSLAEFDREMISERVVAGMARARAKGRHLGRPALRLPMDEVWRLHAEERLAPSEIARKITGTHAGPGGVIEVRHPSPALVRKRLAEVRKAGGLMRWKKMRGTKACFLCRSRDAEERASCHACGGTGEESAEGWRERVPTIGEIREARGETAEKNGKKIAKARKARKAAKASKRRNRR